jgi:hypothetical protein
MGFISRLIAKFTGGGQVHFPKKGEDAVVECPKCHRKHSKHFPPKEELATVWKIKCQCGNEFSVNV